MNNYRYFMEHEEETLRLELKTDLKIVEKQAVWAGIKAGMRVADIGCGPGKTTLCLHGLVQPEGSVVAIDISEKRLAYAKKNYGIANIDFVCTDFRNPLDHLGMFDFVWVRFILEYYCSASFEIVKNISNLLRPGGTLCLIDLDYNSLNHFGLPSKIEKSIHNLIYLLEKNADFDPYIGRKLYSFLYDLGYREIDIKITAHHLIFGKLNEIDAFNWIKKLEIATELSGYSFDEYEGGYDEFYKEFTRCFADPRRFSYTPAICCKGLKPLSP